MKGPYEQLATTAINAATDKNGIIHKLLAPWAEIRGQRLAVQEQAKLLAAQHQYRIVERAIQKLEARQVTDVKTLEARVLIPTLDAAAVESDPDIQELWANLLANAADPGRPTTLKKLFVDVLRSIDPFEAKIISAVSRSIERVPISKDHFEIDLSVLAQEARAGQVELKASLYHLQSLGCFHVSTRGVLLDASAKQGFFVPSDDVDFHPTELLGLLIEACAP